MAYIKVRKKSDGSTRYTGLCADRTGRLSCLVDASGKVWVWTPAAILCAVTAAAAFVRPATARLLIYGLSAVYMGYWLVLGVPRFIAGFHTTEPWQVSALAFVPGIGLVILPAVYCCLVATTYMPRMPPG